MYILVSLTGTNMTKHTKELLSDLITRMEEDATAGLLDDMIPDAMADANEEVMQDLVDTIYKEYGVAWDGIEIDE